MTLRAFSFGGGIQSTAALVLAARAAIDFPLFLFSNVGDEAENPETLTYVADVARPFAAAHGIELVELRWITRRGVARDLYRDLVEGGRSDVPIPVRLQGGGFGNRKCTARYKIEVVARELRRLGATADDPAVVGIGISTDELERARVGVPPQQPWTTRTNPLLDLGLDRRDCAAVIAEVGLPVPPKSSCWFCPYQKAEQWRDRRRRHPQLFARAVALEATLNDRRADLGRDRIGLALAGVPLDEAVTDQLSFGDDDGCDSGWCFT